MADASHLFRLFCKAAKMQNEIPRVSEQVIKEAIRLSELRLAAQLQTRLSLESRLGSSMPWLVASIIAVVVGIYAVRGNIGDYHLGILLSHVLLLLIVSTVVTAISTFFHMFAGRWKYAGVRQAQEIFSGNDVNLEHALRELTVRYDDYIATNDKILFALSFAPFSPFVTLLVGSIFLYFNYSPSASPTP